MNHSRYFLFPLVVLLLLFFLGLNINVRLNSPSRSFDVACFRKVAFVSHLINISPLIRLSSAERNVGGLIVSIVFHIRTLPIILILFLESNRLQTDTSLVLFGADQILAETFIDRLGSNYGRRCFKFNFVNWIRSLLLFLH